MSIISCQVAGCMKNVKRAAYCYGHYMKNWRYGTPTPEHEPRWEDLTGQRFGSIVVVERGHDQHWACQCDCGATTRALTGDLNRGTKTSCGNRTIHRRSDDIGYGGAHDRVREDRGRIGTLSCVGCGEQAQHWSYNHTDPGQRFDYELSKSPVAYSTDPAHYSPRCISCHKRFDLAHINATPQEYTLA